MNILGIYPGISGNGVGDWDTIVAVFSEYYAWKEYRVGNHSYSFDVVVARASCSEKEILNKNYLVYIQPLLNI